MIFGEKFWSKLKELLEKAGLRIYYSIGPKTESVEKTYSDRSIFFSKLGHYHFDAQRHKMLGNYEKALEYLLACIRIYSNTGAYFQASGLMLDVGDCFRSLGMNEIALHCLQESFEFLIGKRDSLSLDLAAVHLLLIVGIHILSNDFEKVKNLLKVIKMSGPEVFRRLQREDCYKFVTTLLKAVRKMDLNVFRSLEDKPTRRVSEDWPNLVSRFQECVELYEILQAIIERFKKSENKKIFGKNLPASQSRSYL